MDREKVLLRLKLLLEEKYRKEAWIALQQGQVILENVSEPNAPIIPEEVDTIVKRVMEEFRIQPTNLAYNITSNGTILVGYSSN